MNSVVKTFFLLILFSVLNSCTVEKRRYSSGYYFGWSDKMARMERPEGSGTVNSLKDSNDPESFTVTAPMDSEPAMVPQVGTFQETRNQQAGMEYYEKAFASTVQKETFPSKKQITSTENQKSTSPVLPHEETPRTHGLAIASLVLGILSVVSFWGGLVFSILAIIFGRSALRRIRKYPERYTGRGLALAGLICGLAGIVVMIAIFSMV